MSTNAANNHDQAEPENAEALESEADVIARMALVKAAMAFIGRAPAVLALYQEIPAPLQRDFESAHLRAVTAAGDFLAATFRAASPVPR